ncbi:MAG: hypothetical protein ACRENA_09965 [Vulcanimicrobiaceae bacterium]
MNEPRLPFYAVLAQLLIAYTDDFDAAMSQQLGKVSARPPSLAMWANVLRFVGHDGIPSNQIVTLSGIAKPSVKSMLDCLKRHGWVSIDDSGRVRLTKSGAEAKRTWTGVQDTVERRWIERLSAEAVAALRAATQDSSLPYYPMPAPHRGAFPRGE